MKRKNKIVILLSTLVIAVFCEAIILNAVGSRNKKVNSIPVAKISSTQTDSETSFIRARVNDIDYKFNVMTVQTWEFKNISINFLDNTLKDYISGANGKFNFSEGDYVAILNIKKEERNGSTFYFATKDTVIQKCNTGVELLKNDAYISQKNNIVDQLEVDNDYNYKK